MALKIRAFLASEFREFPINLYRVGPNVVESAQTESQIQRMKSVGFGTPEIWFKIAGTPCDELFGATVTLIFFQIFA